MDGGRITMEALWEKLGTMATASAEQHKEVKTKLDDIQSNFESVNDVINEHSKKISRLDYNDRRKNLVIFGVPENQKDIETVAMTLFCTHMKISGFTLMELDFCKRLGKEPNQVRPRPILVGLTTQRRKNEILRNSILLKGTSVFVKQDLSDEARTNHKKLRDERDDLRRQGKYAVIRSGQIIWSEQQQPPPSISSGINHPAAASALSRNSAKRASSVSPSDLYGTQKSTVKKTNLNNSMDSDQGNITMVEREQEPQEIDRELFSDSSLGTFSVSTPAQSPRTNVTKTNHRNLQQNSLVPYLNTYREDTPRK